MNAPLALTILDDTRCMTSVIVQTSLSLSTSHHSRTFVQRHHLDVPIVGVVSSPPADLWAPRSHQRQQTSASDHFSVSRHQPPRAPPPQQLPEQGIPSPPSNHPYLSPDPPPVDADLDDALSCTLGSPLYLLADAVPHSDTWLTVSGCNLPSSSHSLAGIIRSTGLCSSSSLPSTASLRSLLAPLRLALTRDPPAQAKRGKTPSLESSSRSPGPTALHPSTHFAWFSTAIR
jgi:hypothetical protein